MSQRTEAAEPTQQKDVGPGSKTGVYYITVCNLPFGTSWQELKDFTRTVCDVDHVAVFGTSTSGWVRINGRQNFNKAWELLNGGYFNGRTIIASDRNKDESIKIKELVDTSPELPERLQFSTQYCPPVSPTQFTAPSSGQQYYGYMSGYSQAPQVAHHEDPTVAITGYSPPAPKAYAGPNVAAYGTSAHYYNYGGAYRNSQVSGASDDYWSVSLPYHDRTAWSNHDFSNTASQPTDPGSFVTTERRKILIRELPFRANQDQVIAWIRKKMGPSASKIRTIEVPLSSSRSEIRGYAYVSFRSSSSAKEAVRMLDQSIFKGRQICARMTTEGITLIDDGDPGPKKLVDANLDKWRKKTRRSKDKKTEPTPSSSRTSRRSPSDKDARSGKTSKIEKIDKRETDEKEKSYSGPLVVDGTTKQKSSRR